MAHNWLSGFKGIQKKRAKQCSVCYYVFIIYLETSNRYLTS